MNIVGSTRHKEGQRNEDGPTLNGPIPIALPTVGDPNGTLQHSAILETMSQRFNVNTKVKESLEQPTCTWTYGNFHRRDGLGIEELVL